MPCHRIRALFKEITSRCVLGTTMDQMDFRVAGRCSRCWMNVMPPKVASNVESFLNGKIRKVLVTESCPLLTGAFELLNPPHTYYFSLSNKECQLVFPSIIQFTQLHACDLGTDISCKLSYSSIFQQVMKTSICILAVLIMFEWLQRGIPANAMSGDGVESGAAVYFFSASHVGR